MKLSHNLRKKIQRTLHLDSNPESDIDELNAVLLQISLAIMLIFMIAFFLFMEKTGGEINKIEELKTQVESARREKLLTALDRTAELYRVRYGLKAFQRIDPATGAKSYDLSGVVAEGKFAGAENPRRSFQLGGAAAYGDYSAAAVLPEQWLVQTLRSAGLQSAELTGAEQRWLTGEVARRIATVRGEVEEVQALAAAALQSHFASHPEAVRDSAVQQLLDRLAAEPAGTARELLLAELAARLKIHVYAELRRISDVPMLENLR